jgi:hypothetical protein
MDFKKRPTYVSGNLEIVSDKNANNGYCGLDTNARVAVARLASNTPAGLGLQVLADNQTFVEYIPAIKLKATTTDGTSTVLTTDGGAAGANQLILANDTTVTFRGQIVARNTTSNTDSMGFEFAGVIRRSTSASNTSLIGTPSKTTLGTDGSAWTFAITADTTNGGLKVAVTGASGKTIVWACSIQYTGVTG